MDFKDFTAGPNDDNKRFDKIMRTLLPSQPLPDIFKAIRKGLIKLNGKKASGETRVHANDVISIPVFLLSNIETQNKMSTKSDTLTKLPIIFENQHIIILNKPYDSLVQGNNNSLDKKVVEYYKNLSQDKSLTFTPGPLHRLDRKTTGLVAFSLSIDGARWFSQHIKDHSIKKTYHAIIQGKLTQQCHWEDFIEKDGNQKENKNNKFHTVQASANIDSESGKIAITDISPISYGKYKNLDVTLAEIKIKTGRMHQIRAQSSLHGFPLLGDTAYGGKRISDKNYEDYIFLHAKELTVPDNDLELPEKIIAPYPKAFHDFLNESCHIEFCEV